MAESTATATELPSRHLPGVPYADLPEPQGLRRYLGASVILTATALGSGELVLWPYITTQVGPGIIWLAVLGITIQYFLNMEIERYTLVTGETAVTGFSRLWLPWGVLFVAGAILPNLWPGWASSGATVFTFIFDLSDSAVPVVATIFLLSIGLAITVSPVVYQMLEKVEGLMVVLILLFVLAAIVLATKASAWSAVVTEAPGTVSELPALVTQLGAASLFGAIVFAGAGGANNLVQSNYIRDKGMGMGVRIPNVVSPITGQEVAAPSLGYMVPSTEDNERRWRQWWKIANTEQLITFWFVGALLLVSMSVLVFSTVGLNEDLDSELSFLKTEGQALGELVAPWFTTAFYVAGFLMLFSTNIGVVDYVSRLAGDSLKVTFLKDSTFWSESKIYITVVWILIVTGSAIIWTGIEPVVLLVISSAGGGFVMAFYSVLVIMINRRFLPEFARLKGWRLPVMVFVALFYIAFSVFLIYQMVTAGPASLA
ncbi:Nramp family divalent metal transporter [Pseudonocardia endophytica]|uniref:Mn2+/Fe2+ NRAMP family transporter n=1 Tax=Pseudonocardia endophytica TaxID=401976 RepID=A0A4R1HKC3_PSEEN|nr:Nramp family divalent metal transporter [Pseudonocardia endophytica]TCK21373.1 Mn2+/Fe2+ NRAMP family transporter [Pseudonocardia endophytica]